MELNGVSEVGIAGQSRTGNLVENSELLSPEAFLTLLVEQLKNQDPLNPMEHHEFVTQLAQLGSVEQLQSLNAAMQDLRFGTASNLIGREIQYSHSDEAELRSGTVESVGIQQDQIMLSVAGESVSLNDVRSVGPAVFHGVDEQPNNEGVTYHE